MNTTATTGIGDFLTNLNDLYTKMRVSVQGCAFCFVLLQDIIF